MEEEYESEVESVEANGAVEPMREVNKDNVLNYESDSEDDQDESEDLGAKMQT